MKRVFVMALLILALALTGCGVTQPASGTVQDKEKAAIEKMVNEYETASFTIDYKTWTGDNTLEFYTPEARPQFKTQNEKMKAYFQEDQLTEKLDELNIKSIDVASDTSATATYELVASGTAQGKSGVEKSNVNLELQKVDGKWLINKRTSELIK